MMVCCALHMADPYSNPQSVPAGPTVTSFMHRFEGTKGNHYLAVQTSNFEVKPRWRLHSVAH